MAFFDTIKQKLGLAPVPPMAPVVQTKSATPPSPYIPPPTMGPRLNPPAQPFSAFVPPPKAPTPVAPKPAPVATKPTPPTQIFTPTKTSTPSGIPEVAPTTQVFGKVYSDLVSNKDLAKSMASEQNKMFAPPAQVRPPTPAEKPTIEFGGTKDGVTMPVKLDLSKYDTNKQVAQIPGVTKPFSADWWKRTLETAINTPSQAVGGFVDSAVKLSDAILPTPKNVDEVGHMAPVTPTQRGVAMAETALSGANLIPEWMAFNTALQTAKEMPGLDNLAKAIDTGFQYMAKFGTKGADKLVDILPMAPKEKEELRPVVDNIGGFISQFLILHGTHKGLNKLGGIKIPGPQTTLTWGDVKDITLGKTVSPEKMQMFQKLSDEGISWGTEFKKGDITSRAPGTSVADYVKEQAQKMASNMSAGLSVKDVSKEVQPEPKKEVTPPKDLLTNHSSQNKFIDEHLKNMQAKGEPLVIDADEFKKLNGQDYDKANHTVYSGMAYRALPRALEISPVQDVALTSGGPGSGKSEVVTKQLAGNGFKGIIVDSPHSNYDVLSKKIDLISDAGKTPKLYITIPDIRSAWKYALRRAEETGRDIGLEDFLNHHLNVIETNKKILENYPNIHVALKDIRGVSTVEQARDTSFIVDKKQISDILNNVEANRDALQKELSQYEKEYRTKTQQTPSTSQSGEVGAGGGAVEPIQSGAPRTGYRISPEVGPVGAGVESKLNSDVFQPPQKESGFSVPKPTPKEFVKAEKTIGEKMKEAVNGQIGSEKSAKIEEVKAKKSELNKDVLSGIRNNPYFRKEKSLEESMGEGWLMKKGDTKVIVPSESVSQYENKGYARVIEIDSLAQEAGFEKGIDYLESQLEISKLPKNENLKTAVKEELLAKDQEFKEASKAVDSVKGEKVTKASLLREKARGQEARANIITSLKNTFDTTVSDLKREGVLNVFKERIIGREREKIRAEIVEYVKESLPASEQGRFITMAKNSNTQKDLINAFLRIDLHAQEYELKTAINLLKKRVSKLSESSRLDVEYAKKIKEVVRQFEFQGHNEKTLESLKATQQYLEQQKANGADVSMPQSVLNKLQILNRIPRDQITLDQIEALTHEIDLLEKLGETKLKSRENLYNNEKELRQAELEETAINKSPKALNVPKIGEDLPFKEQVVNAYREAYNQLQKRSITLTPMDGIAKVTGMEPLKQALDLDYSNYLNHPLKNSIQKERLDLIKKLDLDDKNMERIGTYAVAQQESGYEKLEGMGYSKPEVDAIQLSPAEMEYYNFVRKVFDESFPAVRDYMKNIYNKDVGQIKNYVSFITDFDAMSDVEVYDRFGTTGDDNIRTKTTNQSFTKSRKGPGGQKIQLNIDKIFNHHTDDVAYMLTMGKDIKMFSEIVNTPEMREKMGDVSSLMWKEYLDLMARKGGTDGARKIQWLDTIRKNLGASVLSFKLSSALVQLTSFADGASVVGGDNMFKGAWNISTSKKWREFVTENFPEVRSAVGDDPAFTELSDNWIGKVSEKGMWGLQKMDHLVRASTASGAYVKLMEEAGKEVDLNNPDKEVIQKAQKLVRKSQGSSIYKDQPLAISKGMLTGNKSFDKTLFQFQSFVLHRWDNIYDQIYRSGIKKDRLTGKRNLKGAFTGVFWLLLVASALEIGIRKETKDFINWITGTEPTKDSETFARKIVGNAVQSIPVFGTAFNSFVYNTNPVPAISTAQNAGEGLQSMINGKKEETKTRGAIKLAGAIGNLSGVPGSTQGVDILGKVFGKPAKSSGLKLKLNTAKMKPMKLKINGSKLKPLKLKLKK